MSLLSVSHDTDKDRGFVSLLSCLCKQHLSGKDKHTYFIQPRLTKDNGLTEQLSKDKLIKRLKIRGYNVLFDFLKNRKRRFIKPPDDDLSIRDKLFAFAFKLRCQRQFDDAHRLEQLTEKICQTAGDREMALLEFLFCLADSGCRATTEFVGHTSAKYPLITQEKSYMDRLPPLPPGPHHYGDSIYTRTGLTNSQLYMHYPSNLFRRETLDTNMCDSGMFTVIPGSNLAGKGLFDTTFSFGSEHERESRETLFGGLTQSRVQSLNCHLQIPDMATDRPLELKVPKILQVSHDEGFVDKSSSTSPSSSWSEDEVEEQDLPHYENIWQQALTFQPSRHYTWETRGCTPGITERPFASEAGPRVIDEWYNQRTRQAVLICARGAGDYSLPSRVVLTHGQVAKDVLNLLIAVPSNTFSFDTCSEQFAVREGCYISGLTPESFRHFLTDFLDCGTCYYHLSLFSHPQVMDSFYTLGLVYQAFTGAIRKYLQYFRGAVLSLKPGMNLSDLRLLCRRMIEQIRYLTGLCQCRQQTGTGSQTNKDFPTGVQLLSYLYQETLQSYNTDHFPMLLSILQMTSVPYTLFLQDWVYHGVFRDVYGEFMIQVHLDYLEKRDKNYWTKGYTIGAVKVEDSVPLFLTDLANEIFVCGKTVNLLKLCNPAHFMCNLTDNETPFIRLTLSSSELYHLDEHCQTYVSRMQEISRRLTLSREEMLAREKQAKADLMQKAIDTNTKEMARIQAKIEDLRRAQDAKKRRQFSELKKQMEEDLERRASEKQKEKAEDRIYMERITRREETLSSAEAELELQAREELVTFYAQMTEEAAQREQKALWRIRRYRLGQKRFELLTKEEQKDLDVIDARSDLPNWAVRGLERSQAIVVSEKVIQDAQLPHWAERGLKEATTTVIDTQESIEASKDLKAAAVSNALSDSKDIHKMFDTNAAAAHDSQLPNWAKRGLEFDQPLVITDDDYMGNPVDDTVFLPGDPGSSNASQYREFKPNPASSSKVNISKCVRTTVKMIDEVSVNTESIALAERAHIHGVQEQHVSSETASEQQTYIAHVRLSKGMSATTESIETDVKSHIHVNPDKHVSKESEISDGVHKPHVKTVKDMSANTESVALESDFLLGHHLKRPDGIHSNTQTVPEDWKIKPIGVFGHVSQLSDISYDYFAAPRLKKQQDLFVSKESDSDFRNFLIKPQIRINQKMTASTESEEVVERPRFDTSRAMYATKESEFIDVDKMRLERFQNKNIHGHASQSSVQRLLYGEGFNKLEVVAKELEQATDSPDGSSIKFSLTMLPVQLYEDNFDHLKCSLQTDLLSKISQLSYKGLGLYSPSDYDGDIDAYKEVPLPVLLKKSLTTPLLAQVSLINESIVNYFIADLCISQQFAALRRYLLMAEGDFAQILSDLLFEKLSVSRHSHDIINPVFLNGALTKALKSSMCADDPYADNLSFACKATPKQNVDTLSCLELQYHVSWPINIVVTDNSLSKYSQLFAFMLRLKHCVWAIKDIWYLLKKDAKIHKVGNGMQFRKLQLIRQEMQHFVLVMQGYMANQIIHVTWLEFEQTLNQNVHSLDELRQSHVQYLSNAVFRCMLNKKASAVMKIIQDIFSMILKFRIQLMSTPWEWREGQRDATHPKFKNMISTYTTFRKSSVFLYTVASKLSARGYEPHLQELLLRLNFNDYYK